MKCLAVKEFISIFQFIIAFLAALDVVLFCFLFPLAWDAWVCVLQSMLTTTMIVCVMFGLSTWFFNSNLSRTRLHVRIYTAMILWVVLIVLGAAVGMCAQNLLGPKLYEIADPESVFSELELVLLMGALFLSMAVAGLLLVINCVLTMLAILKYLRVRKRRRETGGRTSDISMG